ncbi:MAG: exosortase [Limisphaerales bacterium]
MSVKEIKLESEKSSLVLKAERSCERINKSRLSFFFLAAALLTLVFSGPLYHLLQLATRDDLYTDIPLVPMLTLYLIWLRRQRMPRSFRPASLPGALLSLAGLLLLAVWWIASHQTSQALENDLAANILAFLLLLTGICFVFLGKAFMRVYACPIALLAFTIPFPTVLRQWIETLLQHGSATFATLFFHIAGAPVTREGLNFRLSDMVIQVAPECSGIHSTVVLVIVSIVGGWLFLRSKWKRTTLVLAAILLGFIRNGFRIFVIAELCMSDGPQMINSPIHRHGGPLFFALSLIPFFFLLLYLRKTEGPNREPSTRQSL